MSIYKSWQDQANQEFTQSEYDAFWKEYLLKEQKNYETILETKNTALKGSISELSESFNMDAVTFAGFLDGINTSLEEELDLETLEESSEINSTIVWDKLFFNMLQAKADWLYEIPAWDGILSEEERKTIKKEYNKSRIVVNEDKIGRNDPCPCGSGKKYKKCCLNK
ncbi:MAG: SEC-C domain-containing protein [Clostridia bacterium]|nr:SEC-C domain-containing protein [Clostridia bacterium]